MHETRSAGAADRARASDGAAMSAAQFTLELKGDVTLDAYLEVLRLVKELLKAIAEDVAPGVPITWHIETPTPSPEGPP